MTTITSRALRAAILLTVCAAAQSATDPFEDRIRALSEELRCLVCQNQTLADSRSGLAGDMRREIRSMMEQGKSDAEIVDYLVQRYGDFVRYRPPVKVTTALLWFGPAAAMLLAVGFLVRRIRARNALPAPGELNAAERARLTALLAEDSRGEIS